MDNKKHIIIFSHGFGVRKDDRGLLSDIAQAIPEAESVLFDYFDIDEEKHTLTARPFSVQAEMLRQVVAKARRENPEAIIDIIAHSQGTMTVALAKPAGVRRVILLAPSFLMSLQHTLDRHAARPDSYINLAGESRLSPLDGLVRIVPAEYWRERQSLDPIKEYNALADRSEVIAITANQDQVAPKADLSGLSPKIKLAPLDGDHGFYNEARKPLLEAVRNLLL